MKIEMVQQFFVKFSCITFHEYMTSISQVVSCIQTNGQIDWADLMHFMIACKRHADKLRTEQAMQVHCIFLQVMLYLIMKGNEGIWLYAF
jgi:hypothetical protein